MANVVRGKRKDGRVDLPVASATVIEAGDLVYLDTAANDVKPASSQADNGAEERNQAEYAQNHYGVAEHASANGDTRDVLVNASLETEYEFAVPSAVYRAGDLLGASENGAGDGLEDQQLEAVTSKDLAIAVVTDDSASARTTVNCKFLKSAKYAPQLPARADANTETLTGDRVLTHDDTKLQLIDPGGASRNLDLPAEEESAGLTFFIKNQADAAEDLTVRDDAAATVVTISQNEGAIVWCDGTTWVGLVGGNT